MKNVNTLKTVAAVALALGFGSAQAATITAVGPMGVSTSVSASCSAFTVAGGLAFGPYQNNNPTNVDASNTLSATCTSGTPYTMSIGPGLHLGSSWVGWRALANGTSFLSYSVAQDIPGGANLWGDSSGNGTGAARSATGTGGAQTFTYAGRIPSMQPAVTGAYTDTLTASLTY